jgi:hypothetical protein
MSCAEAGPGLLDTFNADFGSLLADDAAKALRRQGRSKAGSDQANGFHLEENAWMQTFAKVCRHTG